MKKFDLYILDFDGTLINSYNGLKIFYRKAFASIGKSVSEEECYLFSKMSLQEAFERKVGKDEELIKVFKKAIYDIVSTDILLEHNIPYPDALKFIDFINNNHLNSAIVTGNSDHHIYKVLNYNHINRFTSNIICSEDLEKQKPDPEGILKAIKNSHYQGDNQNICYIGDAWNDFLAAKNAGITPILVDRFNEYQPSDEYIRISSLEELLN